MSLRQGSLLGAQEVSLRRYASQEQKRGVFKAVCLPGAGKEVSLRRYASQEQG